MLTYTLMQPIATINDPKRPHVLFDWREEDTADLEYALGALRNKTGLIVKWVGGKCESIYRRVDPVMGGYIWTNKGGDVLTEAEALRRLTSKRIKRSK